MLLLCWGEMTVNAKAFCQWSDNSMGFFAILMSIYALIRILTIRIWSYLTGWLWGAGISFCFIPSHSELHPDVINRWADRIIISAHESFLLKMLSRIGNSRPSFKGLTSGWADLSAISPHESSRSATLALFFPTNHWLLRKTCMEWEAMFPSYSN